MYADRQHVRSNCSNCDDINTTTTTTTIVVVVGVVGVVVVLGSNRPEGPGYWVYTTKWLLAESEILVTATGADNGYV